MSSSAVSAFSAEVDRDIIEAETKGVGEVALAVYWSYLKECGGVVATIGLVGASAGVSMSWCVYAGMFNDCF
jgi:hypothetical protein